MKYRTKQLEVTASMPLMGSRTVLSSGLDAPLPVKVFDALFEPVEDEPTEAVAPAEPVTPAEPLPVPDALWTALIDELENGVGHEHFNYSSRLNLIGCAEEFCTWQHTAPASRDTYEAVEIFKQHQRDIKIAVLEALLVAFKKGEL